jgi:selenide,water dikinase
LRLLPKVPIDRRLLVGANTADDAGVYRLSRDCALVQTVDFFTPIVDDPFAYGEIAAANALSDVYAMGGRPLTALNLVGMPADTVPVSVIAAILRGGLAMARRAHCAIVGGHTIRNPEPIYGLAVTGLVSPRRIIANSKARPGDWLVLTKPLGIGIVTTAIKRALASVSLQRKAVQVMRFLNSAGAELAEKGLVRAGTDVTGFGLVGHLVNLCRGSSVSAEIYPERLPVLGREVFTLIEADCVPGGSRKNLASADEFTDWGKATKTERMLMADAQTNGGLLLAVGPRQLDQVLRVLRKGRTPCAAVIGRMVRSARPEVRIVPRAEAASDRRRHAK